MSKFLVLAIAFFIAECAFSSVENLQEFRPFEKIEAESYSTVSGGAHNGTNCGLSYLGWAYPAAYAIYYGVDFEEGAELVTFRVAGILSDFTVGYIFLRLGGPTVEPAAAIPVSYTGGNCNYITITTFLPALISGVHDLYVTFDSPSGGYVTDVDWFQFTRTYV